MTRYAKDTSVPAERSRAEIERLLLRYGADQFMYGIKPEAAVIAFRAQGRRRAKCRCGLPASRLCDWKLGGGVTCDAPLCPACTHEPAPNKDLCPEHAAEWRRRQESNVQPNPSDGEKAMPSEAALCRSCQATIVWMKTAAGKSMPVNFETFEDGDTVFDPRKHTSHFATCAFAAQHRRPR